MKTEEQRIAYNAYMREFRKKPEQVIKNRARKNAYTARLRETDPIGYRATKATETRRRRWLNPVAIANEQKKHLFGITLAEYDEKLVSQKGLCALCHQPFDSTILGRAALDHNHTTGLLRGFLHTRCNLAIDHLLESPEICRLAAEYLERYT